MSGHAQVVLARAALAVLALLRTRRRPPLTPVAAALCALATLDAAYLTALDWPGAGARFALAAWLSWPGVSAALSWRVYRASATGSNRRWLLVALLFGAYAAVAAGAPWRGHPRAYALALRAPYWAGPALSLVAWATRSDVPEGTPAAARRIAALLAWSAFLDVAVGALAAPDLPWWLAHATTAMTLGLVAGALLLGGLVDD